MATQEKTKRKRKSGKMYDKKANANDEIDLLLLAQTYVPTWLIIACSFTHWVGGWVDREGAENAIRSSPLDNCCFCCMPSRKRGIQRLGLLL